MRQVRNGGFAMLDVLVAMLLLAITLTGACATLVQTMRATHSALLASLAVDLAADLVEELRSASTMQASEALLASWRARVSTVLPVGGMAPEEFAAFRPFPLPAAGDPDMGLHRQQLVLRWNGSRGEVRELTLPVTAVICCGGSQS